ncbi:MAG: hypothetical protein WDO73_12855 [Ignavibacteriota bacterium]
MTTGFHRHVFAGQAPDTVIRALRQAVDAAESIARTMLAAALPFPWIVEARPAAIDGTA